MTPDRDSAAGFPNGGDRRTTKRWVRDGGGPAPGQGYVLVADADPARREAYARALGEMGFTTQSTGSGREALDALLAAGRFDAAVLDIDLKDQSGLQVLAALMRRKTIVPVVIPSKAAYQHEFEVMSYPKKTFMQVRDPDLVALAVRQLVPTRKPAGVRLETDLSAEERARCRELQEMLVVQELPDFPGWESAALYQPCSVVGGDYLDIFQLPSGRVGIVVADVSGHGFPGALIMVMVRTAFRLLAPSLSPHDTILEVNRYVTTNIKKRMFVSALYAVLDPGTGLLEVINCGQNPPVLVSRSGGARVVPASGLAMGLNGGGLFERELRLQQIPVEVGEQLLLYTDGVPEAKNASNEDLGDDALLAIAKNTCEGSAQDLVDAVAEAIVEHRGASAQSDDITIVAFKRNAFIGSADVPTLLDQLE
jgi:serine phosphatase RsbU (regulator of sigma subunit)